MESLFTHLTHAIESASWLALLAAMVWGVLSILLSPCHLASLPLIIGFMSGQGNLTPAKAYLTSTLFSLGIFITITLVGLATACTGAMLGDAGSWGGYMVASVFLIVGLHLLEVIEVPWISASAMAGKKRGLLAAFVLGLLFGIAVGPCTFAFMAPALIISFKIGTHHPIHAVSLLLAYGIGHCGVIIVAGGSIGWVNRYLNWNEGQKLLSTIRKLLGALLILIGLILIYLA